MKLMFLIGFLLASCAISFAQGDDPGCDKLVTGKDGTCSRSCGTLSDCEVVLFHVDCGNQYQLRAWTSCASGAHCAHCASCAYIFTDPPGPNWVARVTTQPICVLLDCDSTAFTSNITPGNYLMYVCLVACTENDAEACCAEENGCQAYGCLKWGGTGGCP